MQFMRFSDSSIIILRCQQFDNDVLICNEISSHNHNWVNSGITRVLRHKSAAFVNIYAFAKLPKPDYTTAAITHTHKYCSEAQMREGDVGGEGDKKFAQKLANSAVEIE